VPDAGLDAFSLLIETFNKILIQKETSANSETQELKKRHKYQVSSIKTLFLHTQKLRH